MAEMVTGCKEESCMNSAEGRAGRGIGRGENAAQGAGRVGRETRSLCPLSPLSFLSSPTAPSYFSSNSHLKGVPMLPHRGAARALRCPVVLLGRALCRRPSPSASSSGCEPVTETVFTPSIRVTCS
eukprot:scaffold281481_cov32-Tisochrysis_lutea.AAC.7